MSSQNNYRNVNGRSIRDSYRGILRISPDGLTDDVLGEDLVGVSDSAGNVSNVYLSSDWMAVKNSAFLGTIWVMDSVPEGWKFEENGKLNIFLPTSVGHNLWVSNSDTTIETLNFYLSAEEGRVDVENLTVTATNTLLDSSLSVQDNAFFYRDVDVSGDVRVHGNLLVEGDTTLSGEKLNLSVKELNIPADSAINIVKDGAKVGSLDLSVPAAGEVLVGTETGDYRKESLNAMILAALGNLFDQNPEFFSPFTFFDVKWSDKRLDGSKNWLLSDGKWHDAADWPRAWKYIEQRRLDETVTEVIPLNTVNTPSASVTATYYVADNGMRIVTTAFSEDTEEKWWNRLYDVNGTSWFYLVDFAAKKFKMPRTTDAFLQFGDVSYPNKINGFWTRASLPNIKGAVSPVGGNSTSFERASGALRPTAQYIGNVWGSWQSYNSGTGDIPGGSAKKFEPVLLDPTSVEKRNGTAKTIWNQVDVLTQLHTSSTSALLCGKVSTSFRTDLLVEAACSNPVYGRGRDENRHITLGYGPADQPWLRDLSTDPAKPAMPVTDDPHLVQPKAVKGYLYFFVGEGFGLNNS